MAESNATQVIIANDVKYVPATLLERVVADRERLSDQNAALREALCHGPDYEQVVTDILFALADWTDLPDGPSVDDARAAVMRELESYFGKGE